MSGLPQYAEADRVQIGRDWFELVSSDVLKRSRGTKSMVRPPGACGLLSTYLRSVDDGAMLRQVVQRPSFQDSRFSASAVHMVSISPVA